MTALVDALACYEIDRHHVAILCLGCVEWDFAFPKAKMGSGLHAAAKPECLGASRTVDRPGPAAPT
ncbi:protein of unknown function [Aminobacter niigataensis]|nr:protein of unknown function [Aminobacter niigataensis]